MRGLRGSVTVYEHEVLKMVFNQGEVLGVQYLCMNMRFRRLYLISERCNGFSNCV